MENRLKALFDYQKFQGNKRLVKMMEKAQQSLQAELDDDDLVLLAAAGETDILNKEDNTDAI